MRNDFPLFKNQPELIYLDSAATALKPSSVLEAEQKYGTHFSTNATRGLYPLAEKTSAEVEAARQAVADFIGGKKENIIFTSSTTAGINMLAYSIAAAFPEAQGEVLVSVDAHHSQIIPWAELTKRKDWDLIVSPVTKEGHIDSEALLARISEHTRVVALTHVSNVYGVINNLPPLVKAIREKNPQCFILVDAAQAVAHMPLHVAALGVDALVFSGHKLYGSTGVGVCYLTEKWQQKLSPSQFGGGMVQDTSTQPTKWKPGSEKFEAGTLPLTQIFGIKEAVSYLTSVGFSRIQAHEQELLAYSIMSLITAFEKHITFLGTTNAEKKIGLLSFTLGNLHPHDIASLLGEKNICVRAGEHCASFLHRDLHIPATTRISFGLYTTKSDIDIFVEALKEIYTLLSR